MKIGGIIWIYPNSGGGGGPANPGGTGWGGGIIPTNESSNVTVYSWDKDPSVTFSTINQTILTDPRSYAQTPTGAQTFADDISGDISAIQGAGGKACLRYWFEDYLSNDSPFIGNWWEDIDAYDAVPVTTARQDFWDAFNARITSNGDTPDYLLHDLERGISYYQISDQDDRQGFFEPITINNASNPYPNDPNPYIGAEIWRYGAPLTDMFIQEWEQFAAEARTDFINAISGGCPVAQVNSQDNRSNYNDYEQSYEIGDLRGNNRIPAPQTRLSDISAPESYLDWDTEETLTNPESEYSSARQAINRRRWKKMIWRHNKVKSALTAGDRCHPWIAPPGYGYSGADTWASSAVLPFEKMLWRVYMRHLRALGIDTFILWNPVSNNPNSEDTDTFMDAYFTDLKVRNTNSAVGLTPINSDTIVTNDRITHYNDIYRIRYLYWQEASSPIEPFSQGFGTSSEPLIVNAGATGEAELAAFYAALEIVYGDETDGGSDAYQVPQEFKVSGRQPIPE